MELQKTLSKAFEVSRCLEACLWFCWVFFFLQRVHGADGDCLQRIRSNAIRSVLLTARTSHRRQWPSFYQDLVAAPLDCRPITTLSKSWERWMTGGYLQITIQEKKTWALFCEMWLTSGLTPSSQRRLAKNYNECCVTDINSFIVFSSRQCRVPLENLDLDRSGSWQHPSLFNKKYDITNININNKFKRLFFPREA